MLGNHKITLEIGFNYHFHLSNTFHKVMLKSFARQNITRKVITCNNESTGTTNQQAWPAWKLRFRILFKIITSGCHLRKFTNWLQEGKLLGKVNGLCFLKEIFLFPRELNKKATCYHNKQSLITT